MRIPVYHPFLNKPVRRRKKVWTGINSVHLTSDRLFTSEILIGIYTETWRNISFMGLNCSNQ